MFKTRWKEIVSLIIVLSIVIVILCGCGFSKKTQNEMQLKVDQYEEALRYNYTSSYTIAADSFRRISAEIAEFVINSQTDSSYLKGKISGLLQGDMLKLCQNTYNLCDEKIEPALIPDEMREASESLISAYRERCV